MPLGATEPLFALGAFLLRGGLLATLAVTLHVSPKATIFCAGALYYLYRALIDERPGAWLGVGICMGLGLLSKCTMVLLGGAAVLFIAATPASRRWLKRPEPYLAAVFKITPLPAHPA